MAKKEPSEKRSGTPTSMKEVLKKAATIEMLMLLCCGSVDVDLSLSCSPSGQLS